MPPNILIKPLTPAAFKPYGDVLDTRGTHSIINEGMCERYNDLAQMDFSSDGRPGISIFKARRYQLPLRLEMMERHPLGSQAFLPMAPSPFLLVVAENDDGRPSNPRAFMTSAGQGVNYHRGVWHAVLTPLEESAFFVVDWIGNRKNLEEYRFETPLLVQPMP